jgi:hypothetical protein
VTLAPDLIRRRDRALKTVGERWYLDFKTKEIRRKDLSRIESVRQFFWRDRNTVWEFYVWLRHRQAEPDAMCFSNQIDGDNIPIKGFPKKYALQGGWTIPRDDLIYLSDGPLASEDLHEVLVPPALGWSRFADAVKQFAPVVTVLSGIIAIASNWGTVIHLVSKVANAF